MAKVGRNETCPCGSGRKFKQCCATKRTEGAQSRLIMFLIAAAVAAAIFAGFSSRGSRSGGRIWSAEHGHYHDASGRDAAR
jgi:hypothetical protein